MLCGRRQTRFSPLTLALVVGCLGATAAIAQDVPGQGQPIAPDQFVADPGNPQSKRQELPAVGVTAQGGNGFALSPDGRSRLHFGLDTGAGFDTNPFSLPTEADQFAGDVSVRVRPKVSIDSPGSLVAFDGLAMVDYGMLPGLIEAQTQQFLLYQSLLSADLEVNRGGMLRFAVGDSFSWNSDPSLASLGVLFNRMHNQLRAGAGLTPGGGALDMKLGYTFDYTNFFDVQGDNALIAGGVLNNMQHGLSLRMDYKFLPRTGFFGQVSAGWSTYLQSNVNPDSFPLTAIVGVQGQLLSKVAGLVSVGYSNPFVVDQVGGAGRDVLVTGGIIGVVGQAELQWTPSPTTRLGGGFQRSIAPTPLYQFATTNRLYTSLSQLLGGRFLLGMSAGYSILEFGEEQIALTDTAVGRLDGHLDGLVNLSYFFTDWLSLGITNKIDWRLTNANDLVTGFNFGFVRNQTYLLASLAY